MDAEHENGRPGAGAANPGRGFDAIQFLKADVQNSDVGLGLPSLFHGFQPAAGFANDGNLHIAFENTPQFLPHFCMIVND
jgi:hypothetical protein